MIERVAALLMLSASMAACGEAEPPPEVQCLPQSASTRTQRLQLGEIGQDATFRVYAVTPQEEIERGIQGGYHIFLDGRLQISEVPDWLLVELQVHDAETGEWITEIVHHREMNTVDAEQLPTLPEMIIFMPESVATLDFSVDVSVTVKTTEEDVVACSAIRLDLIGFDPET